MTGVQTCALPISMNPDHKLEYTIEELEELFQNATEIKSIKINPIGLIRLPFLEISKIPLFLGRYCDQILIVGKKGEMEK